jgi:5'-3' exonuclease
MTKTFPEKPKNIEKALVDGDILAYRSAFATQDKTSSDTEEVIDELMEYVVGETIGFYSKGALKVYLTGTNNFRHEIAKTATYKGHRKKMEPPEHLPHAREYLQSEWGAVVVDGKEADDAIATEAYNSDPLTTVICSIDKDMLTIPGWMFNPVKGTWVFSNEWDSLVFFYTQILTGDASDQIWGLHRIGPKKAEKILEGATTELELYERCLKAYRDHPDCQGEPLERVLENGRLLHLQRYEGQLWEPPT